MYINTLTKKYPYSIFQLRQDNPEVSFPKELSDISLAEFGVYPVRFSEVPSFDRQTQTITEDFPVHKDGEWLQQWKISPLSDTEIIENKKNAAEILQAEIVQATQERLDSFARTRNYDGILSACTYATSNVPKFSREGQAAVNLRDATWAALYQILEDVQTGKRDAPTGFQDIEADLPALEWPV